MVQSTDNNGTCEVTVELSVTTKEVYESLRRLLEERQTIGANSSGVNGLDFYVTSLYTSLRRSAVIYPKTGRPKGGRRVDTTWCTNGLLDEVKDNGVSGNAIAHYENRGRAPADTASPEPVPVFRKRTSRNGIALDLTNGTLTHYDTAGQPLQWNITGGNPGTPVTLSFTHAYDNAGLPSPKPSYTRRLLLFTPYIPTDLHSTLILDIPVRLHCEGYEPHRSTSTARPA